MLNALAGSLLFFSLAAEPEPRLILQTTPAKRVEAVMAFDLRYPQLTIREWIVYAPVAPELSGQTQVNTRMEPEAKATRELSPLRRSVIGGRIAVRNPKQQKELSVRVTYQVTLHARKLVPLPAGEKRPDVAAPKPEERKAALAATARCNFQSPEFQKWLADSQLRRKKDETDLAFARRVFLHIKSQFTYKFPTVDEGTATSVAAAGCSDCGGLSLLFAGVMRANGVPARVLVGRWAMSSKPGEQVGGMEYHQWHAKAEFFAEGVGWVPVDQSLALDDKSPDGLFFFGNDPGDFLVQHLDHDLVLDTIHFGKETVEVMQGVINWMMGQGATEPAIVKESWTVRALPGR